MPIPLGRIFVALGLIALGVVGIISGDFALTWQPVPQWVPWRQGLAILTGLFSVACGAGLLVEPAARKAARLACAYFVLWLLLLKTGKLFSAPLVEATWNGFGEIAVLVAGGLVLDATVRPPGAPPAGRNRRILAARLLFGAALLPIGLSHFVYADFVAGLVPSWLPCRLGWGYLSGAGHLAAGLGVLLGVYPRLAAIAEAGMIMVFTLLVWLPAVGKEPTSHMQWTPFLISWLIGAAAWVVADSYEGEPFAWGLRRLRSAQS
ncbi:MAG TPA: hypothetical protein VEU07_12775 [Candidatus Acidoferrum sp.]|nr:hypothetical protein [Candidatus Acidoferrum sp.]